MSVKSLCLRFSVMQTGLLIETPEDQSLVVQSSMEDVLFTLPRGLKRSCHSRVPSLKHMLPLQLSWMPSSSEPFFVGYSKYAFSCICTWTHQLHRVLSRKGVGRLRHLSCRVLWLQNLVGEKMLQVKAVLGTINPADVSTKRLSIARLESLMYLFGLWNTTQHQLVGAEDPGRIFRHIQQSTSSNSGRDSQLRVLISALNLLTLQLQGCEAMTSDLVEIPYVFTATWVGLLGMHLFWMSQCSKSNRGTKDDPNFGCYFPMRDDDVDTASVASCMTEDTDEPPAFSPEGLIDWMFERCNRRFEDALISGNEARAQAYGQRRALLADIMNFARAANDSEREQANEMLNTIDDLSSHESSPSKDMEETEEASEGWSCSNGHAAEHHGYAAAVVLTFFHLFNISRWFLVQFCISDDMDNVACWILMVYALQHESTIHCSGTTHA